MLWWRAAKQLHERVVKGSDAPILTLLDKHSEAQFLVRWRPLTVWRDEPAQFISDVRKCNVRPDKAH